MTVATHDAMFWRGSGGWRPFGLCSLGTDRWGGQISLLIMKVLKGGSIGDVDAAQGSSFTSLVLSVHSLPGQPCVAHV